MLARKRVGNIVESVIREQRLLRRIYVNSFGVKEQYNKDFDNKLY